MPHPLIVEHADVITRMRADLSDNTPDMALLVALYDALAQAPVGSRPALRRGTHKPSVTHLLTALGFRDPPHDWSRGSGGGGSPDFYLARGRALHRACELDDGGTLDERTVDDAIRAHLRGFRKFRADMDSRMSVWWELQLASDRLGLTGRPDNLRWLRGRRTLVDVKTNAVDPATLYQLALYELLLVDCGHLSAAQAARTQWVGLALVPDDYRIHLYAPHDQAMARQDAIGMLRTYQALAKCRA